MNHRIPVFSALCAGILLAGCDQQPPQVAAVDTSPEPSQPEQAIDEFMAAIAQHCGRAYSGRIIANQPPVEDDPFEGQPMVMHVRECTDTGFRIPFHVGEDRSRTWVLTRTESGLRLKHDHRHEDGSDDAVTMYGGTTETEGSAVRQEFPVDEYSIGMFEREGLSASVTNVWAMEIEPDERFMYELARPGGRLFQVEFDLRTEVAPPPAPWGHE